MSTATISAIATAVGARARRRPRDEAPHGIRLRSLTPTDAHHVTELLERLSVDSRYQRYFRLVRSLSPAEVARFVAVGPGRLAVGAFVGGDPVGVAQYSRLARRRDHAEVAVRQQVCAGSPAWATVAPCGAGIRGIEK